MSATVRRWRTFAVAAVSLGSAVGIAATVGCSSAKSALDPYATATLTQGTGLGDLQLGETTFGAFLAKFGPGLLSVVVSDETAWEATFENGQISFLFVLTGDCKRKTAGTRVPAGPAVQAFLASHPECRDTPLTSISVARPFFKGKTDQGVALGSPVTATR